jgi:predicted nucleic acid-binding Zn ribbon protein
VLELWEQLLPEELARHCRIEAAAGTELRVAAESGSYAHELRMCAGELLAEIRRQCPGAKIRSIKVVADQTRVAREE